MTQPHEKEGDPELAHTQMTFGEHLNELRSRILKALWASLAGLAVVFVYHKEVFALVTRPYREVMLQEHQSAALVATGPTQPFFAHIKVSFIVGLILTAPFWIYQLWLFIGAGLYAREKRIIYKLAPLCFLLFLTGVVFGYLVLIPIGLDYLLTFADPTLVRNLVTIPEYLRLFTILTLLLGVAFQLPVVMLGLVKAGMATPAGMRVKRKYALVLIFILAAVFTPPDPVTQVLLATPLVALYEMGLLLAWLSLGPNRPPVNWKAKWPALRKALIVAGLLFVFRGQVAGIWRQQAIDANLYQTEDASKPPLLDIAAKILNERPLGAYRVDADGEDQETWLLRLRDRCALTRLRVLRVDFQVVDRSPRPEEERGVEFRHFPQEVFSYRLTEIPRPRHAVFVPRLLEALEGGGDEVREEVRNMLALIAGFEPAGSEEEVLEAFRKWYSEHADETLGR